MSESEYTGPFCGSDDLPSRRKKLSIRPCATNSSCMLGMLALRLVFRRLDQNPSSITTARTGTGRSLAYGERAVSTTPAFFHTSGPAVVPFGSSASAENNPPCPARERAGDRTVAAVEARNVRRDQARFMRAAAPLKSDIPF